MSGGPASEQDIILKFQDLQNQLHSILQKIAELEGDFHEHEQVLATLEPLDGSRKFCRLVSGVLIERTVAEVIPAVKGNRDNLGQIIASLKNQMEGKQKEIAAFQTKYKITVRSGPAGDKDGAAPENKGVLV